MKLKINREYLEAAEAVLIEAGFASMQIEDAFDAKDISEHPEVFKYDYLNEEIQTRAGDLREAVTVTLYFSYDEEGNSECRRAADIAKRFGEENAGSGVEISTYVTGDDSEWLYKWQEHFKPSRIGERIVVKPGWEDYEAKPGDLVIEMDPGMAFGSGLHETTTLCIKALERYLNAPGMADDVILREHSDRRILKGKKVLDVGTGTGILAIAAALLGAADCLGIDIDDEAVRVASENVEKNGLGGTIAIIKGDLTEGVEDYEPDVIVANLMADLVVRLSPSAARRLRPGGIYITSGILDIKEQSCRQAIEAAGFEIIDVLHDGEWCAIVAKKA